MNKMILKCKECGDIDIQHSPFTDYDDAFIFPVKFAKTISALGKLYKRV